MSLDQAREVLGNNEKDSVEYREDNDALANNDILALAATYVPGSDAEKAFVRKIDRHIIPTVWVLYTFSYLDRANIG